jgi:hypothetical protein
MDEIQEHTDIVITDMVSGYCYGVVSFKASHATATISYHLCSPSEL